MVVTGEFLRSKALSSKAQGRRLAASSKTQSRDAFRLSVSKAIPD